MKKNVKETDLPEICKIINEKMKNSTLAEILTVLGCPERLKYNNRTIEINHYIYRQYYQYYYEGLKVNLLTGVMENNKCYYRKIVISFDHESGIIYDVCFSSDCKEWFMDDKLYRNVFWVKIDAILERIKKENFGRYEFLQKYHSNIPILLSFPALEILYKAGYTKLVDKMLDGRNYDSNDNAFNRNFKNGTSPKTIFQMPKSFYKEMKNIDDLKVWDNVRKLAKKTVLSAEALKIILTNERIMDDIDSVYAILNAKWHNKSIFSVESLINYLNRIDMNEAIENYEGIIILRDYLRMCNYLKMKPKIDGDSLKREHDIAARLCRQIRNERLAERMEDRCAELQKYNYEEDIFLIRGIKNYDDLLDEATQQHNCVASYAQSIAEGRSLIYVMREKKAPEKSLITIELTPKTHKIRQKLLAYNCPIRNKAQTEFIERWHKHVLECV